MKAEEIKAFKSRLVAAGLMCVIIAALVASVAASRGPEARVKLGGAWIGELAGIQWTSIHAPLDADGKIAVARLQWCTINADFLALAASFGVDRNSEASGAFEMISKDTAKYRLVFYGIKSGGWTGTGFVADEVKTINVMTGTWRHTGPDTAESQETLEIYLADGGTLFPSANSTLVYTASFPAHPQHRIPMP